MPWSFFRKRRRTQRPPKPAPCRPSFRLHLKQLEPRELLSASLLPIVSGISPSSGSATGGTQVVITGSNFSGVTEVDFGPGHPASFTVNSATSITVGSPAESAGTVDITVRNSSGTSATSTADRFTFVSFSPPTVTAVSPGTGPTSGGTVLTISGTNLSGVTTVVVGGIAATNVAYNPNTNQITATTSAHTAGMVDVMVTTNAGTSAVSSSDKFTYSASAPAVTSTALASSAGTASHGQTVTLTATVSPFNSGIGTPTGTVTFKDGSSTLGTASLNGSGQANFTTSSLAVGTHSITVVYGGTSTFAGSTSNPLTQTVNQASTTTSLVSSASPATLGQPITVTATVLVTAPGTGVATGTVTFLDGSNTLGTASLTSSGLATLTIASLGVGTHSLTALYSGDTNSVASTSSALSQVVNPATTITTVGTPANPAAFGQSVALTATVTGSAPGYIPSGTVTFKDGSTTLGTATLNGAGQATMTTANLSMAVHSITAVYGGDGNYTSSSSPTLALSVNPVATATTLSTSASTVSYGQPLSITARVTISGQGATSLTGSVTLEDNGTTLGMVSVNSQGQAVFTTAALAPGSHSLTAGYSGDSYSTGSTSSCLTESVAQATTTTAVTSSLSSVTTDQAVTLTATISPGVSGLGTPTGMVTFLDGSTSVGSATLNNSGQTILTTAALAVGSHSLTVVYAGDGNYTSSTSPGLSLMVNPVANQPPMVVTPGNQTSAEAAVVSLPVSATVQGNGTLAYSVAGLPLGLAINPSTGVISGTVDYSDAETSGGTYTVTVTTSANGLAGSQTFTWTVTNTNRPPVVTSPANRTSAEGASVSMAVAAYSPDNNSLTYSATGLPKGLTINSNTGVISGTVDYSSAETSDGTYAVTVTATDSTSASTSQSFTWVVTNTPRAPVSNDLVVQTSPGAAVAITLPAIGDEKDSLSYSIGIGPKNGTVTISGNVATYTPNSGFTGTDSFTYQAHDGNTAGNVATVTLNVATATTPSPISAP